MIGVLGIHHITAIASHAQRNLDFYAGVLGLRLVKRTVNFDDPTTHHLYYGDETGAPGSIVTFFPWQGLRQGRVGAGQVTRIAFAVPAASFDWWRQRLGARGVTTAEAGPGSARSLAFHDGDGLPLELVADDSAGATPGWAGGSVPADHAIRRFAPATLVSRNKAATAAILETVLGLSDTGGGRYGAPGAAPAVVLTGDDGAPGGLQGAGTVHHIAFRVAGQDEQLALRERAFAAGLAATEVLDRQYFRSVYFREPGGILFELATDGPGFAVDEAPEQLGTSLRLPPWLRTQRAAIEAALPPLDVAAIAPTRAPEAP